jgi:hypothetical protein
VHTDRGGACINAVFDEFFAYRLQIDNDLSRLYLVHRTALYRLDRGHVISGRGSLLQLRTEEQLTSCEDATRPKWGTLETLVPVLARTVVPTFTFKAVGTFQHQYIHTVGSPSHSFQILLTMAVLAPWDAMNLENTNVTGSMEQAHVLDIESTSEQLSCVPHF